MHFWVITRYYFFFFSFGETPAKPIECMWRETAEFLSLCISEEFPEQRVFPYLKNKKLLVYTVDFPTYLSNVVTYFI